MFNDNSSLEPLLLLLFSLSLRLLHRLSQVFHILDCVVSARFDQFKLDAGSGLFVQLGMGGWSTYISENDASLLVDCRLIIVIDAKTGEQNLILIS